MQQNAAEVSDEQDERFHLDIQQVKRKLHKRRKEVSQCLSTLFFFRDRPSSILYIKEKIKYSIKNKYLF